MTGAVLSLGSNLGDRSEQLAAAVRALGRRAQAVSAIYRTPPWGPVEQQDFHNIVLLVDEPELGPHGWLARCRKLEQAAGRRREFRWGPRTLDADVIAVGDLVVQDAELTLPHPRAHERAFVLVPWYALDPAAVLPGHGPVGELIADLPPAEVDAVIEVGRIRTDHAG